MKTESIEIANFKGINRDLALEFVSAIDSLIDKDGKPRKDLSPEEIEVIKSLIFKILGLIVSLTETKIDDRILKAVRLFL